MRATGRDRHSGFHPFPAFEVAGKTETVDAGRTEFAPGFHNSLLADSSSGPQMGQLVVYTQTQATFYPAIIVAVDRFSGLARLTTTPAGGTTGDGANEKKPGPWARLPDELWLHRHQRHCMAPRKTVSQRRTDGPSFQSESGGDVSSI
jgi:hypothetical protein